MSMAKPSRRFDIDTVGGVTIVSFVDERIVNDELIDDIGEQLLSLVEDRGLRRLVLNFGRVKALSSAALAKLFSLRQKLATVKGRMALCCVHGDLLELFALHRPKGAPPMFEIFDEEQDAIDSFAGAARPAGRRGS